MSVKSQLMSPHYTLRPEKSGPQNKLL